MVLKQKKLGKWFTNWKRKINRELNISPEVEIIWVSRPEQKKLGGYYEKNKITLRLHPNNSESKVKYLYAHEARHCWQEYQNTHNLWNEKAKNRLLELIKKAHPELRKLYGADLEEAVYRTPYYNSLPEEVDANVYAYEKTKYKYRN